METKNILILTAVQMEAKALKQAVGDLGCRFHTVGIRARHQPSTEQLSGICCVLMCGLAGGLDPSLKVGDVILQDENRFAVSVKRGTIHTADELISTPQSKAELFARTGASAVDMEQAIVQRFAESLAIPVYGLRAISDTAAETLNPSVLQFVDQMGKPRPMQIAAGLIRNPALIPYLQRLNANTKYALLQLSKALKEILTSVESGNTR